MASVLDDKEAVQQLERQRRDGEEIERDDRLAVILKECTPLLGRVAAAVQASQIPRDSPYRDDEAEFLQLAMGLRGSPIRILVCQAPDQAHVVPLSGKTLVALGGKWVSAGTTQPVFDFAVSGRSLAVDMSAAGRPLGRGIVLDFADIFVDFPDANGFTGRLQLPNTIHWSNNSLWQKLIILPPSITSFWETAGQLKTLFVQGNGFPEGLVTIKVHSQNFEIAHFAGFAGSDGGFLLSQSISCTGGGTLSITVFEGNQATPVVTSGTLCPVIAP